MTRFLSSTSHRFWLWRRRISGSRICSACLRTGARHRAGAVESIDAVKVAVEILTATLLAFIAAGITAIYKVERLPLAAAAMIQLAVLYADYILIYLFNGWLENSAFAIGIFTGIFIVGFAVIWYIILLVNRHKVAEMNRKMQKS